MKKVIAILAAVLLVSLSVMPAFAATVYSPEPTRANYNVVVNVVDGGSGTYTIIKVVDDNGDETIQLSAITNDGYEFTGWTVEGDATGDLSDPNATFVVKGDVVFTPNFKSTGVQPTTGKVTPTNKPTPSRDVDKGDKSPQTGSNDAFAFVALSVVALALVSTAVVAKKTSKK